MNENLFEDDDEHRIMIDVTRGLLGIYENNVSNIPGGTNIIIADFPLRWTVSSMGHLYDTGINAVITSQRAIPARLLEPKVKNRSRIHYLMANIEASQFKGKDNWALLLDEDGFISEGTGDNFFIVKNGEIITPEGRNILRGISRDYIFELAEELRIPCKEKNIEPYDVIHADEAFMTGTPFCLLPVMRFNGQDISDGKMGSITSQLLDKWSKNVGLDIVQQIKSYSSNNLGSNAPSPYEFRDKK
jgi:branched-chain amino acid aminotransferase